MIVGDLPLGGDFLCSFPRNLTAEGTIDISFSMGNTIETVRVYDGYVRVQNGFWHMDLSGRIYFQRCWFISDHREGILTEYKFWLPGIRTASRSDTLTHGKFIGLKRWQRTRWGLGVG